MDRTATSRALNQEIMSFSRQRVSLLTIGRHLHNDFGYPWRYITGKCAFNIVFNDEYERRNDMFSDEFLFCLQHHDGPFCVWCHLLPECIQHLHTDPSPGEMVWAAIGCVPQSLLVPINSILNSISNIYVVLRPVALFFIWALFQQCSVPTENVWSMVTEQLALHQMPITTVDEL